MVDSAIVFFYSKYYQNVYLVLHIIFILNIMLDTYRTFG